MGNRIGETSIRKDAFEKVTGQAKFTGDIQKAGMLHVHKVISPYAHALIKQIEITKAKKIPGVHAVIIGGEDFPLTGEEIRDRYPIATDKVRYYGEVVALVVADTPKIAKRAADLIQVVYEPLPVVNNPRQALNAEAPILHERLADYQKISEAYPKPGTNVANHTKIRKGNIQKGWEQCQVIVEEHFSFSPSDHAAMETRCALAEIHADGKVIITSSSQAPFMIKRLLKSEDMKCF